MLLLFMLVSIFTELLLRRRTSWKAHTERLALAISEIQFSSFKSSFLVRMFTVPILHWWKWFLLTTLLMMKVVRPRYQERDWSTPHCETNKCSYITYKIISFVIPGWRIISISATTPFNRWCYSFGCGDHPQIQRMEDFRSPPHPFCTLYLKIL